MNIPEKERRYIKCRFCAWKTVAWRSTKKGKHRHGGRSLEAHVRHQHKNEYEKICVFASQDEEDNIMHELQDRPVKALRKNRACEWCGEMICKGEPAQYRVYVMDGFTVGYMHPECYLAMRDSPYWAADCWEIGEFQRGERAG